MYDDKLFFFELEIGIIWMTKKFRDFYIGKTISNFIVWGILHILWKTRGELYNIHYAIGPYKYLAAQKSRYLVHILELEADLSSIKTFDNYTFGAKRTTAKN